MIVTFAALIVLTGTSALCSSVKFYYFLDTNAAAYVFTGSLPVTFLVVVVVVAIGSSSWFQSKKQ
jgi:hypothetical protein